MSSLRRSGRATRLGVPSDQPAVLLDSKSPYESRRLVVTSDGVTSTASLHNAETIVGSAWVANHAPAPAGLEWSQVAAGQAPLMPAGHTKHPGGTPALDPRALRALWFEEGDGVAVLEGGQLLAVIPGWSDMSRGMPGYSRDALGQTPFAWSLDDAMEGLGARADRASAFWRWRQRDDSWSTFQQSMLGHLLGRLGPGGRYWDVAGGKQPMVGVSERPPTRERPYSVLSTLGMCCQRMPAVEQAMEDPGPYSRVELALATTLPTPQAARVFLWLGQYPWRAVTWFGTGHTIRWYHEPATFPLGNSYEAVLLLENPSGLLGPDVPDLSGFSLAGDPVRWLWVIPIRERDRMLARERGAVSLVTHLAAHRRSWVAGQD
ncbi:MAG TPA: suppressor of fused domain protein [Streptosporangiaceae bacterium]|nr:suppressor of fused domain protein [Streptosporangiaceae bacterium]